MPDPDYFSVQDFVDIQDPLKVTIWEAGHPEKTVGFETVVKNVLRDRILIDVPTTLHIEAFLKPGNLVDLTFLKGHDPLPNVTAVIIQHMQTGEYGCWVEVPTTFRDEVLKRRHHVRVAMKMPMRIHDQLGGKPQVVSGESINLSGGGIRFVAGKSYQVGDRVTIECQPDPKRPPLKIEAEIVFSGPAPPGQQKNPALRAVAAKFISLIQHQEDFIVGLCFRKELEQQRHLKGNI